MKNSGAYAGAIALIAIVVIAGAVFVSQGTALAEGQKNDASAIVETKAAWQNARNLLDKSAADAFFDSVSNYCTVDAGYISDKMTAYLGQTLASAADLNCRIVDGILNTTVPTGNDIEVSLALRCVKGGSGFFVAYEKTVAFKKMAFISPDADCYVDIQDRDSGACEIDSWLGGGCGS